MNVPDATRDQIMELVKAIPHGRVMSYGQIAARLGIPDVRIVGWALGISGGAPGIPWWRVMNNEGKLTIQDPQLREKQKELLAAEGIVVNENFILDIERYRHGMMHGQKKLF